MNYISLVTALICITISIPVTANFEIGWKIEILLFIIEYFKFMNWMEGNYGVL